jgi:glycosyltransferase involved in cell wall biosynthesis
MSAPLVSVIVPVYNGERHLREALDSILVQAYRPLEVLVVDDGSTDGSASIIRSYSGLHRFHQSNAGVAAARNLALERSRGELVAFLDQDDQWAPHKLRVQYAFLAAHPEVDYVFAHMQNILQGERPAWLPERHVQWPKPGINPGTLLARRPAFDRVGVFDPSYVNGSDTDWHIRAVNLGLTHAVMPDVLLLRCVHEENESHHHEVSRRDMFHALHASIRRRGKAGGP